MSLAVGTAWLSPLAILSAALFALQIVLRTPLNFDVAWVLFFSRRWLDGARPYIDIIDYKPPVIFLLGLPIERLAIATGWPESRLVAALCLALATLACWLMHRILRAPNRPHLLLVTTVLAAGILTMLAAPARELGEPEQLMIMMVLPYMMLCAADSIGETSLPRALRACIGGLACIGFILKPLFLIAYVALVLDLVRARRGLRAAIAAEHVVIALGAIVSALALVLLFPAYVRDIIPMAYAHHWLHGESVSQLMSDWMVAAVTVSSIILTVGARWLVVDRDWAAVLRTCALGSLAMLIAFLGQGRAVTDHFLPVRAFNFLAACIALVGFLKSLAARSDSGAPTRWSLAILAARTGLLALLLMPTLVVIWMVREVHEADVVNASEGIRSPFAEPLLDVVELRAAGKPVFVMSSGVMPAFPLVNLSGATWPYRFNSLSLVSIYYEDRDRPVTAAYRPPPAQSIWERAFFDAVVEDLTRRPPALLVVDQARLKPGFGLVYFDFLTYYQQSPAFATLLSHYRPVTRLHNYQVFEYDAADRDH